MNHTPLQPQLFPGLLGSPGQKPQPMIPKQTVERYMGRPMMIAVETTGAVFAWPKGTQQRYQISVLGAWQTAQRHLVEIERKQRRK